MSSFVISVAWPALLSAWRSNVVNSSREAGSISSRVRMRVPSGIRSSCRNSSGSRPSPDNTTVNREVASKSALDRIRSSLSTSGAICWASSMSNTGLIRVEDTWDFHRSRSARKPPQRLEGVSLTAKISPSSR